MKIKLLAVLLISVFALSACLKQDNEIKLEDFNDDISQAPVGDSVADYNNAGINDEESEQDRGVDGIGGEEEANEADEDETINDRNEIIVDADNDDSQEEQALSEEESVGNDVILVLFPKARQNLTSPILVQGIVKKGYEQVAVAVKNTAGNTLIKEDVKARLDEDGNNVFKIALNFQFINTKAGSVDVYTLDEDGGENNVVSIPVMFSAENAEDEVSVSP